MSLPKPLACIGCPLYQPSGYAPACGTGRNGVLLVGEALGAEEVVAGEPFVGPAGRFLNMLIANVPGRPKREDFVIDNTVRCRPPGNVLRGTSYEVEAILHCAPYLNATISYYQPKAIVALGATAMERLTGQYLPVANMRGYVLAGQPCPVIPTFHPSFLMRGMAALSGIVIADIAKALDIAANGYVADEEHIEGFPSVPVFKDFAEQAVRAIMLACDIETVRSRLGGVEEEDTFSAIERISFAYKIGHGISVPWQEPFISISKRLLASSAMKVFWNYQFDVPRLKATGCVVNGRIFDAMLGWRFLQPSLEAAAVVKPGRLGFVAPFYCNTQPWKHLGQEAPEFYSAKDSLVTLKVAEGIKHDLETKGLWPIFVRHRIELLPVLKTMSVNGLKIDREAQAVLKKHLDAVETAAFERLQPLIPDELKPFHPKEGYKRTPKITKGLVSAKFALGKDATGKDIIVERWAKRLPFLPSSPAHIKRYMLYRGHRLPRNKRSGSASTEADGLLVLAKVDPVYQVILDYKKAHKITSTYIYELDEQDKVHTHFTFASTGRLRSYDVNLANIPQPPLELADKLRATFVAEDGNLLLEADWSAIEAVLTGYFADDAEYVALAKRGVHTFMASHMLGKPLDMLSSDGEVAEMKMRAKATKLHGRSVYDAAKRGVYLSSYRGTPVRIHGEYPDSFPTVKDAARFQDMFFSTIGRGIRAWQDRVVTEAWRRHKLQNPFGYPRWFWDIQKREGKWVGDDAKKCVAFLPQSTGAAMLCEVLLELSPALSSEMRLPIYDSLLFSVPEYSISGLAARVGAVMGRPWPELGGLQIGVEIKAGKRWNQMEEIK